MSALELGTASLIRPSHCSGPLVIMSASSLASRSRRPRRDPEVVPDRHAALGAFILGLLPSLPARRGPERLRPLRRARSVALDVGKAHISLLSSIQVAIILAI